LILDGIEPKIFPGVVSRRRRSSLRGNSVDDVEAVQGQSQHPTHSGFVRMDEGAVAEEKDSDD
jgi:AMP deaminase